MKSSSEIELELEEAKKQETLAQLERDLVELKRQYEGKVFGTNTFERNSRAATSNAIYYESFFIDENEIYVKEWSISRDRYDSHYKFTKDNYNFSRNSYKRCLTNEHTSPFHALTGYNFCKKEIPLETFMSIFNICEEVEGIINESFKKVQNPPTDILRVGTSRDEDALKEALDKTGIEYFDLLLPKYKILFESIQYCNLPGLHERRFLLKGTAKITLEYQVYLNNNKIQRVSNYRSKEWLRHRNKNIQEFIDVNL